MRQPIWIVVTALSVAVCCLPVDARSAGRFTAGALLWRHETNLQVERATDFDGSDMTNGERALDWDATGSGLGARLSYEFPRLLTVYGEAGTSQATVRDRDTGDPAQPVSSRGLDSGGYFAVGVSAGDYFGGRGNTFWKLGGSLSSISAGLDRDVFRSWEYDETRISGDFKVGTWAQQIGVYGGVRLVSSNADLRSIDRTNLPGQQVQVTELRRDGPVDLLLGAQTRGNDITGFTEVGMVGTFSAAAGLLMRF